MEVDDLREDDWLFTTNGKDVWRVKYWYNEPTVTLTNLETGEDRGGAVYSLLMQPFVKLIPAKPIEEAKQ